MAYKDRVFTITNGHVCALGEKEGYLLVISPYIGIRRLYILEVSPNTDLCLLQAAPLVPAVRMGSSNLKRGDWVSIVGHPLLGPLHNSIGNVDSGLHWIEVLLNEINRPEDEAACQLPKNRIQTIFFGLVRVCELYVKSQRTSATIKPGNSGSPVFDRWGLVRGVAFASNQTDQKAEIIPWESLNRFLKDHYARQHRQLR